MSVGSTVRRMFGRHERLISDLWRGAFIRLDDLSACLSDWVPDAKRILEIGCGEGAVTELLARTYPEADILAIDITPNLGRQYAGPRGRVRFEQIDVATLATSTDRKFDLIVMCDVLHHIPVHLRDDVFATARTLLTPGGKFVCKDWARTATPVHWAAYAADRWLTGDRIRYATPAEAEDLLCRNFGTRSAQRRTTLRPWRNNYALLLQPEG